MGNKGLEQVGRLAGRRDNTRVSDDEGDGQNMLGKKEEKSQWLGQMV
jgi:hypothetical protein